MINWTQIPFSLGELNVKLENCSTRENLKEIFGLTSTDLATFIEGRIRYPIESYDLTYLGWQQFLVNVKRLFPDQTDEELQALRSLQAKVKRQFARLLAEQNPGHHALLQSVVPAKSTLTMNLGDEESGIVSKKECMVSEYLEFYQSSVVERGDIRLTRALSIQPLSSDVEKAELLQFILCYLLGEKQYMKKVADHAVGIEEIHEKETRFREGSNRIIRLSSFKETKLYEITEQFENNEEYDLWLSLSPFISFRKIDDRSYVCFVPFSKQEHAPPLVINHLKQVKESGSHEKIRYLADKLLMEIEFEQVLHKQAKKFREVWNFTKKFAARFSFKWIDAIEMEVTPYLYLLANRMKNYIVKGLDPDERCLQIESVREFKIIIDCWEHNRASQKDLYETAYKELRLLIEKNRSRKSAFLRFTKNLLGDSPADLIPERYEEAFHANSRVSASASISARPRASSVVPKKQPTKRRTQRQTTTSPICSSQVLPKEQTSLIEAEKVSPYVDQITLSHTSNPFSQVDDSSSSSETHRIPISPLPMKELPGEPFPYSQGKHMVRWALHPFGCALPPKKFPEYADQKLKRQILMQIFHFPHPFIDRFLYLSIEGIWKNVSREKNDLRKVIPAEISFQGKIYRGFIAWAIDIQTNVCYHRCFSRRIDQDFLCQTIQKTFDENDFPELNRATLSKKSNKERIVHLDSTTQIQIHPLFGSVTIIDYERNVKIKLFKTALLT
ncbi:MAG: hypothetical protein ACHQUC_02970 [Chlamydiales bacterium]